MTVTMTMEEYNRLNDKICAFRNFEKAVQSICKEIEESASRTVGEQLPSDDEKSNKIHREEIVGLIDSINIDDAHELLKRIYASSNESKDQCYHKLFFTE